MRKYTFALIMVTVINLCYAFGSSGQLDTPAAINSVDQVFNVSALKTNESNVKLNFSIAQNFYIYKQRLKIVSTPNNALDLTHLAWPTTLTIPDINDPTKSDEVFTGSFHVNIPIMASGRGHELTLEVTIQGCDGKSICYPPQTLNFELNQDKSKPIDIKQSPQPNLTSIFMRFYHGEASWQDLIREFSLTQLIIIFFLSGIAIALTPCMYPLYPIALTMIMGNAKPKRSNVAFLVLMYMQGIAFIYVTVGVIAGLSGKLLTTVIQTPVFMFINAGIWLLLGLAMFGWIEIKLPHRLNSYLHHKSNNLNGGKGVTVFIMGIVSSLLLEPCVTPPLIAAIGFIVGLGNVVLGVVCLYAISMGMGVPLLILALLGGRFLPRSGKWMSMVKYVMGMLLIAVSISLVYPYFKQTSSVGNSSSNQELVLESADELNSTIAHSTKPVLIDFYAAWCSVCKKMEHQTFVTAEVKSSLNNYTLIKFDITKNTADQARVLQVYGLYGPPALIILNKQKQVIDRLLGFTDSATLVNHLEKNR